jgi:hypothetical protein
MLVNVHRAGKHLIVLAHEGSEVIKLFRTQAADHARRDQPSPPKVV